MIASIRHRSKAVLGRIARYPRWLRLLAGVGLVFGGILGFLPVLGFWMIPLGVWVLSHELHSVRRMRRRFVIALGRKRRARYHRQRGSLS